MLCPECNFSLSTTTLKTKTQKVTLDYCSTCGGVWTEFGGQINFLRPEELNPLNNLLPYKPLHPNFSTNLCPKDRQRLELLKGENIPYDVDIYRCNKCSGVWFPEGALRQFKEAQQTKIDYYKVWKIPLPSIYTILLPMILLFVLLGGMIFTILGIKKGTDVRTRAQGVISKPLVISPEENQVIISFTTEKASVSKIKYWIILQEVTELWVSSSPKTTHTIQLKNLKPNKSYSYQIMLVEPEEVTSPTYLFKTQ